MIAFVGCAHIHVPGFISRIQERPGLLVKYTWDHDAERSTKCAAKLNARPVSDLQAIWNDADVESVIICSETNRHEELVLAAVAARKRMFVEKPLGIGAADAYKMARAIDDAGLTFQTGYFMRGQPIHLVVKEHVEKGSFGTITRIRHTNCHQGSLGGWFDSEWRWMADPTLAGVGAFGDLGTHSLDILLWLMGDVESATASVRVATGRYGDCDEYGEGMLNFASGTVGTLAAGWVDWTNATWLHLSGTEGFAYAIGDQLYLHSKHIADADGQTPWTLPGEGKAAGFDLFLDFLEGKADAGFVTPQEAAYRCAVMEAMYQGSRSETWIRPRKG